MILAVILLMGFALFLGVTAGMNNWNRTMLGGLLGAWVVLLLVASGGI